MAPTFSRREGLNLYILIGIFVLFIVAVVAAYFGADLALGSRCARGGRLSGGGRLLRTRLRDIAGYGRVAIASEQDAAGTG